MTKQEMEKELQEQARLLGISGSREAALMAKNDELRKALRQIAKLDAKVHPTSVAILIAEEALK
jgi:hypothetical protein